MKLNKVLMVEPKAPARHVFSLVRIPRLGLPVLGTIAKRRGLDTRVIIEETAPVQDADLQSADLLCISTITPTAPRAYELADRARAAGIPVIMGGAHVTFLPDEALEHSDWVMRGEADTSFEQFLDMLEQDGDPASVPGLSYIRDGRVVNNNIPAAVDMDSVVIPDFSLLAGLNDKHDFDLGIIPVQTSRGCPHNCNFCSVTPMFGHRMRYASAEHVAEELNARRGHGNSVFFYDDNFCASPKRTKALLNHLLSHDVYLPPWMTQVSVRAARDDEMMKLMHEAGCYRVFIGLESIESGSLTQYHKQQSIDDIRYAVRRFHENKIQVHGMFMFGSDADDAETIRATRQFVIDEKIDTVQFMVLTPLPGTPVYDNMSSSGRLLTEDWSQYDAHHAVFRPERISAKDLTKKTMEGMGRVYSGKRILGMVLQGQINQALLNFYARKQVKRWKKENRELWKGPSAKPMPPTKLNLNRGSP